LSKLSWMIINFSPALPFCTSELIASSVKRTPDKLYFKSGKHMRCHKFWAKLWAGWFVLLAIATCYSDCAHLPVPIPIPIHYIMKHTRTSHMKRGKSRLYPQSARLTKVNNNRCSAHFLPTIKWNVEIHTTFMIHIYIIIYIFYASQTWKMVQNLVLLYNFPWALMKVP